MKTIRLHVPEEVAALLADSFEERNRRALETIVLELYRRRDLSSGRAAEMLGLDRIAFIRWSDELGIQFLDMTPEELQQEHRTLEATDRPDIRS